MSEIKYFKEGNVLVAETSRLKLREITLNDVGDIHIYSSDPENVRYINFGPNTVEQTEEFVAKAVEANNRVPRCDYELGAVRKSDGVYIGSCGIYTRDIRGDNSKLVVGTEAEIGWILNKKYWRCGYGTEIAAALIDLCFNRLKVHRVYANCHTDNVASYRVMEKNAMRFEGLFKKVRYAVIDGEARWYDVRQYAILEDEYFRRPN